MALTADLPLGISGQQLDIEQNLTQQAAHHVVDVPRCTDVHRGRPRGAMLTGLQLYGHRSENTGQGLGREGTFLRLCWRA